MQLPQFLFFSTRSDLAPGLSAMEESYALDYLLRETRTDEDFVRRRSLLDDGQLGTSDTGSIDSDAEYLVYPRGRHPRTRVLAHGRNRFTYTVEPSTETLLFRAGGMHAPSGALVAGRLARNDRPCVRCQALYEAWIATVFAGFTVVRGLYHVGPEAYRLFKAGHRLATLGVGHGADFDLAES